LKDAREMEILEPEWNLKPTYEGLKVKPCGKRLSGIPKFKAYI